MCLSLFPAQTEVFVSSECRKSLCEGKNVFSPFAINSSKSITTGVSQKLFNHNHEVQNIKIKANPKKYWNFNRCNCTKSAALWLPEIVRIVVASVAREYFFPSIASSEIKAKKNTLQLGHEKFEYQSKRNAKAKKNCARVTTVFITKFKRRIRICTSLFKCNYRDIFKWFCCFFFCFEIASQLLII